MNSTLELEKQLIAIRDFPDKQLFNLSQSIAELRALEELIWFEGGLLLERIELLRNSEQ